MQDVDLGSYLPNWKWQVQQQCARRGGSEPANQTRHLQTFI